MLNLGTLIKNIVEFIIRSTKDFLSEQILYAHFGKALSKSLNNNNSNHFNKL